MKTLNTYINEAWGGVKQHTLKSDVEAWCEKMGIKRYTINSKGEIDVDGNVNLRYNDFKELPYKFGRIDGCFGLSGCKNLISLKNCPDEVVWYFSCSECIKLNSLVGCPKKVGDEFYCYKMGKKQFTEEEVRSLCKVKGDVVI